MYPDPSICRVGADFYLVNSSFEYFPGVPIFHSRDLVNWTQIGHVLTRERQLNLDGRLQLGRHLRADAAPPRGALLHDHDAGRIAEARRQLLRHGGRSARPVVGSDLASTSDGFDPSLLFADGEVYYLRDGKGADHRSPARLPGAHRSGDGHAARPDAGHLGRDRRHLAGGGARLQDEGAPTTCSRPRAGRSTGTRRSSAAARRPLGPFEPSPRNPILSHRDRREHPIQATGHVDLVELDDGTTWAVFLGVRPQGGRFQHLGRETFLAPVTFSPDGWPMIGDGGRVELRMPAPALPPQPPPAQPARDDFDHPSLTPAWNFIRNPNAGRRLADGAPRLPAPDRLGGHAGRHGVARRDRAAAAALPRPLPRGAGVRAARGERGGRADRARQRRVSLRRRRAGAPPASARRCCRPASPARRRSSAACPIPDGPVVLEVSATETSYTFTVGAGGAAAPRCSACSRRARSPRRRSASTARITSPAR